MPHTYICKPQLQIPQGTEISKTHPDISLKYYVLYIIMVVSTLCALGQREKALFDSKAHIVNGL